MPNIDFLGCKITLNYFLFYVFVVYIPPSTICAEVETFLESLSSLDIMLHTNLIFLGDFNIPLFYASAPLSSRHKCLLNVSEFLNLTQYNTVRNSDNRLLDLVFASFSISLERSDVPLVDEDPYHRQRFLMWRNFLSTARTHLNSIFVGPTIPDCMT